MGYRSPIVMLNGCDCEAGLQYEPLSLTAVRVPFHYLFLGLMACPTIAFIRGPLRRWRRRRKGLCVKCAYDLTGNVSGVCPECGVMAGQL